LLTYTPPDSGLPTSSSRLWSDRTQSALRPGPAQRPKPPSAESSFARRECYSPRGGIQYHLEGRYPLFIAHTSSCVGPDPSHRFRSPYPGGSPQVGASPCWEVALPDVISCNPYTVAWTHTPRRPPGARARRLPRRQRPSRRSEALGTPDTPCNATSTGCQISGLQPFTHVQAPMLAGPPGCTYRRAITSSGQPGRIHHAGPDGLPTPGSGIATRPIEHLTRRDLHPLDYSFVGCYHRTPDIPTEIVEIWALFRTWVRTKNCPLFYTRVGPGGANRG